MSKRKATSDATSDEQQRSISRKYEGLAGFRDLSEQHIQDAANLDARSESAQRTIAEVQTRTGTVHQETFDAAGKTLGAAHDVSGDMDTLTSELGRLKNLFKAAQEGAKQWNEQAPVHARLQDSQVELLQLLEEFREVYDSLLCKDSAYSQFEVHTLRKANIDITNELDLLRARESTTRSLLVESYQAQRSASSLLDGIELPEWFPRESEKPFEVIETALRKMQHLNAKLRLKCVTLQQHQEQEKGELRAELEEAKLQATAQDSKLREQEAAAKHEQSALKTELDSVNLQLHRERESLLETNRLDKERLQANVEGLQQQIAREQEHTSTVGSLETSAMQKEIDSLRAQLMQQQKKSMQQQEKIATHEAEREQDMQDFRHQTGELKRQYEREISQSLLNTGEQGRQVTRLEKQLTEERSSLKESRQEIVSWTERYGRLWAANAKQEYTTEKLRNENAKLLLERIDVTLHERSVEAIRQEADARLKENQQREQDFIAAIQRSADSRVERVEGEKAALEQQIKELRSSQDLSATIQAQQAQAQHDLAEKAAQAAERASSAEQAKLKAEDLLDHLKKVQSDVVAEKVTAVHQKEKADEDLQGLQRLIVLLEKQQKDLEGKMEKKLEEIKALNEKGRSKDVLSADLRQEFKGACEDVEFLQERAIYYRGEHEKLLKQVEQDEADMVQWGLNYLKE
jgi:DNA repair exonuclease SbcCD ATPase subunit